MEHGTAITLQAEEHFTPLDCTYVVNRKRQGRDGLVIEESATPFFRGERRLQGSAACPPSASVPRFYDVRDPPITLLKKLKGQMFLVYLHVKWVEYSRGGGGRTADSSKTFQGTERRLQPSMQVSLYTHGFLCLGKQKYKKHIGR